MMVDYWEVTQKITKMTSHDAIMTTVSTEAFSSLRRERTEVVRETAVRPNTLR